ncbi:MAG: hypothetical protein FWC95_02680 [Defluviitaleaceae bacterium]|nr:hypothetical protein [Defluviitaleaceae bacterium]
MTPKQRFISALKLQPVTGLVPAFELVFFLTMEAFGKLHPSHRHFHQWSQMSQKERDLHLVDIADTYIKTAELYGHDGIFVHGAPSEQDWPRLLELIRERAWTDYFLVAHGDPTFSVPDGNGMMEFTEMMYENPEELHRRAKASVEHCIRSAERLAGKGLLDGYALCSDYCFNANPFFSPSQFSEFVTPYLEQIIREYRNMGFYSIKHTDGNMMPIVDQIIDCKPDALHSLDPQGGVDLKYMKERYGKTMCLIGNVNCGLLDTGTDEEVRADVLRALRDGMPGGGFIFGTSNCVYTGMPLERYEMMMELRREFGNYDNI